MNLPAEDVADSRSNVAGRKRALHTSSEQGREVISIDSSSDESAKQPRKRAKQNTKPPTTNPALQSDLTHSSFQGEPAEIIKSGENTRQPVAWNQGVQSGLRTSFQSKKALQGPLDYYKTIINKKLLSKLPIKDQLIVVTTLTQDAKDQIDLHGWPLPKEDEESMKYIREGLTFYPAPKKDQNEGYYSFNGGTCELRELLDAEGKPIQAQCIDASDLIRRLLEGNEDLKRAFAQPRVKPLYNAYMSHFYSHVPKNDIFPSLILDKVPMLKDIFEFSGSSWKENVKLKPEKIKQLGKKDETSNQKAKAPLASSSRVAVVIPIKNGAPPTLARAVDHYDGDASALENTTEFIDEETSQADPTLITNGVDLIRDGRTLDEADAVDLDDRRPSASIVESGSGIGLLSIGGGSGSSSEVNPEDRIAILKYFPTTDGIVLRRCLVCGSSGHEQAVCPDSSCSSCGYKGDHLTPACPRTVVCGKCRRVGHQTSHCPEKLRVAKEDIKCVICQSPNHDETECHFIWRSFLPSTDEIKKVKSIAAFCYYCGRPGHFGPECGLYRRTPASGGISWSQTNIAKYLRGPNIVSSGVDDYSTPDRNIKKGFSIKGKANDPIELGDSDDEDFIQAKVNQRPKNGQIQFSQASGMQALNQEPFQFQGNTGGNPNGRGTLQNQRGRGGHSGSGCGNSGERKKPKSKSGNSPTRGGGASRGKAYRGAGGGSRGGSRGEGRGRGRGGAAPRGGRH